MLKELTEKEIAEKIKGIWECIKAGDSISVARKKNRCEGPPYYSVISRNPLYLEILNYYLKNSGRNAIFYMGAERIKQQKTRKINSQD